jgi:hypothetical protein
MESALRPSGACKGRVVSLLEGGYDTRRDTMGLATAMDAHVKALRRHPPAGASEALGATETVEGGATVTTGETAAEQVDRMEEAEQQVEARAAEYCLQVRGGGEREKHGAMGYYAPGRSALDALAAAAAAAAAVEDVSV